MSVTVSLYIPESTIKAVDEMAARENRSRSNMAATLLESSIKALIAARDNPKPYPALPEAPADTDEVA